MNLTPLAQTHLRFEDDWLAVCFGTFFGEDHFEVKQRHGQREPNAPPSSAALKVKAKVVDPKTRVAPEANLNAVVTLMNCSLTASGQPMSCQ